ncbi:MAG: hypothetical protein JWL77_4322 [Chthonomonadaceae bacterium]|nr:hypothetical protein [Chthonomonadaceae bacterium]
MQLYTFAATLAALICTSAVLHARPHKVLIELVNANHQTLDYGVINFYVAQRSLTAPDPKAGGFRSAPKPTDSDH